MNKFLFVFLSLCIFGQHVHSTTKLLSSSVKDLNGDLHPKHRHLSEEGTLNLRIDGRGYFQYRLPVTLTDASNDPSQKRRLEGNCFTDAECSGEQKCNGQNCMPPAGCNNDAQCLPLQILSTAKFFCDTTASNPPSGYSGVCTLKKASSEPCNADYECASDTCSTTNIQGGDPHDSPQCYPPVSGGQPCRNHAGCITGFCDPDQVYSGSNTEFLYYCGYPQTGDCASDEYKYSPGCNPLRFGGEYCNVNVFGGGGSWCLSGVCENTDGSGLCSFYTHTITCDSQASTHTDTCNSLQICNANNECTFCGVQDDTCYGEGSPCCSGLVCQEGDGPDQGTCVAETAPAPAPAAPSPAPAGDGTCDTDCSSCTTDSTCIASQDSCNWKATGSGPTDGSCAPSYHEAYADSPPPANANGIGGLPDKGDGTNSVENTDDGDGDAKTISEVVYSRDGSMHVNKFGYLVDDNGFLLVSESRNTNDPNAKFHIHIPSRADDIVVTPTGKILAMELGGGSITKVGQLKVVRFENAQGLNIRLQMKSYCVAAGESGFNLGNWCEGGDLDGKNHTYMSETEVSGPGIVGNPGDQGFGRILKSK